MRRTAAFLATALLCLGAAAGPAFAQETIRVGAKNFTEQEILGEAVAQLIERHTDLKVERRFGLGGTEICHSALVGGEIDVYVEYTGTALLNVLDEPVISDPDAAFRKVASRYRREFDAEWLPPIGFNNTYAITVRSAQAERNGWTTVSDLRGKAGSLDAGFTSEFMERPDGYPGLKKAYGVEFDDAVDLDPGLMYKALADGQVDVICAFATDGRIEAYDLRVLDDDLAFFPPYDAAPVIRGEVLREHPEIRDALAALAGTIGDAQMRRMNHAVDESKRPVDEVVGDWIEGRAGEAGEALSGADGTDAQPYEARGFWALMIHRRGEVLEKTLEHLLLTGLAMAIAIGVGVPTGILIHRIAAARAPVLTAAEIVQTVPSLAMLAFLFAVYGLLGRIPAVTALVFYALLPLVLNTYTGLRGVAPEIIEAARGVGMSGGQRLRLVELPLALPVIIAGVRTSTVWTVGIATLSTYIGAGGLGDFIARGLARNDSRLTLLGAVPAALMAIVLSLVIRGFERLARRG